LRSPTSPATDLNTWHSYLPGYGWRESLGEIAEQTYEGSTWNFETGNRQARQPNLNSEFGNVWGYEGSTGDVDWSWDYHRAVNEFRRHPVIAGWLYTEHHDVVNEWNGYWRYDRSAKETGLGALVEGMSLRDLHAPLYLSTGQDISRGVQAGETVSVPLYASYMTGRTDLGDRLNVRARLYGWDRFGQERTYATVNQGIPYLPWFHGELTPLRVTMPDEPAVAVLSLVLEDALGNPLHHNFTTFVVGGEAPQMRTDQRNRPLVVQSIAPADFSSQEWSLKQWGVLNGLKVNGAGHGYFEYEIPWPDSLAAGDVEAATFLFEASAKQLFGKDRDEEERIEGDYMRGRGTFDPSLNPNSYPMTDETVFPSAVSVRFNGVPAGRFELQDDPADHRGILSWHAQPQDNRLREAGSYGYRIAVTVPTQALEAAAASRTMTVRLEVDAALPGGLALYGARFGRYPMDPTLIYALKTR
jgi:hypothetical protein